MNFAFAASSLVLTVVAGAQLQRSAPSKRYLLAASTPLGASRTSGDGTSASEECGTALSIEHFSSRHSLSEKCFWRTMQSQQGDSVSGARRPVPEPMIENQAVWTD